MLTTYNIQAFIQFLSNLEDNNNRLWFDANRTQYKLLAENFKLLTAEILNQLTNIDPLLFGIDLKNCIYRINRDTRFGHNKSPYNTHISALFSQTGKQDYCIGYYFRINQRGELTVGGGQYVLDPKDLFRIRTMLAKDSSELEAIVKNKSFKSDFGELASDRLKTCPKGFAKDNPNLNWLQCKNYVASSTVICKDWSDQKIIDYILPKFSTIKPFITWLRDIA
jgi:uncharacterized protein (TIGR02453 family)